MLGLHQRLYNTALEERIRVYKVTGKGLSFTDQCKALTQWRKNSAGLRSMNAQSGQVTLKRLDAELKRLGQDVSRKIRMAQKISGRHRGFSVSANLRKAIQHLARLHAKIARSRKDFLHQTSAWLVNRFGAIATEALDVKNMVHHGGERKRGLNREIQAAAPGAFLRMLKTKAEEAGSWYEEAPTRTIKPTQRCHACWRLPDEKKTLSDRQHRCPHCGAGCGRDENAARVLLRWLEMRLAGSTGSGREPSEARSGIRPSDTVPPALKRETHAIP